MNNDGCATAGPPVAPSFPWLATATALSLSLQTWWWRGRACLERYRFNTSNVGKMTTIISPVLSVVFV